MIETDVEWKSKEILKFVAESLMLGIKEELVPAVIADTSSVVDSPFFEDHFDTVYNNDKLINNIIEAVMMINFQNLPLGHMLCRQAQSYYAEKVRTVFKKVVFFVKETRNIDKVKLFLEQECSIYKNIYKLFGVRLEMWMM